MASSLSLLWSFPSYLTVSISMSEEQARAYDLKFEEIFTMLDCSGEYHNEQQLIDETMYIMTNPQYFPEYF